MKDLNYIALDLELNNLNDGNVPKIIEVGVAVGSPFKLNEIKIFNWYVNPNENISPFITQLTGITDEDVIQRSTPKSQIAEELIDIINNYKCFTNPITWGQGDVDELKNEFKQDGINLPIFGRRIFDVKTIYVFDQMVKGRTVSGGLKKAMNIYGIKFEGKPHRAGIDAHNTLRLFFHLLINKRKIQDSIELLKQV